MRRRSRPKGPGELDVRFRFVPAPLLDERARQPVVGIVVRGCQVDERPELRLRLLEATEPEVRDGQGLSNRARARLASLRLLEGDRRLRRPPRAEMRTALLEEVVRVAHG